MKMSQCLKFAWLLLLLTLPVAVQAQFGYMTKNGTITITKYTGSGGAVTIPDTINGLPVTSIGDKAFQGRTRVTEVTIPYDITSIGSFAFSGCTRLTGVYFQGDAPSLGSSVFRGDNHATVYYLPGPAGWDTMFGGRPAELWPSPEPYIYTAQNGTITINKYTGSDDAVTIPDIINGLPVTSIGDNAFSLNGLTSVTIPTGVTSIGVAAFGYCTSLSSVTIPDGVTNIGVSAFFFCLSLTNVTIPNSVTGIEDYAFYYTGLSSVTVPNNVTSIGDGAFERCTNLSSITIGDSVTSIGDNAFQYCPGLTGVYFQGNAPSLGGSDVFNGDNNATVYYSPGTTGWDPTFGGLTTVLWYQFTYTTNNGTITITGYTVADGALVPSTITIPSTINYLPVTSIGRRALSGTNLTGVTIPDSVTSIGDKAFDNCFRLSSVTIPDSVTSIGNYAFEGSGLTNVTIGSSVTNIGAGAFTCYDLTSVTIPNSVTSIGDGAFLGDPNLTAITVDSLNSFYSSVDGVLFNKNQTTLIQCPGGKAGRYTIPNSVTNIGDSAFSACILQTVTIPHSVTSIGDFAFSACYDLSSVTIPHSVTSVGNGAFAECTRLSSVTIPDSVTSIGLFAFSWCTKLTAITVSRNNLAYSSVAGVLFNKNQTTLIQCPGGKSGNYTIPDTVSNIGTNAFSQCVSLTNVTIPNSVSNIGVNAFSQCTSLTNVTIPNSVTSIGGFAFFNCSRLPSVTIPDSVTSVGDWAFAECTSLTGIYFRGNAPSLGSFAFSGDNNATVYYLAGTTGWGATFGNLPTAPWNP
jgi:hypothetical protein